MLDNFSEEYLPEVLIDREKEQQAIANFLKDISTGISKVLYVHGSPGIGKTTVTKHILNQFQDSTNDAIVLYLNCPTETPNVALKKIYETICGEDQRRLASAVMMQAITSKLLKKKISLILALDNFDRMNDAEKLLWNLYGLIENLSRVGLILISTSKFELQDMIGNRLYSRVRPQVQEFSPYNAKRLYEIISNRIANSKLSKVVQDDALWELSTFVANNGGSARHLIRIFADAVSSLQYDGKKLTVNVAREILEKEKQTVIQNELNELREHAPRMYEVLKIIAELCSKNEKVYTGLVADAIRKRGLAVSGRSLDYYLNNLESKGIISLKNARKAQGHTREIRLNYWCGTYELESTNSRQKLL